MCAVCDGCEQTLGGTFYVPGDFLLPHAGLTISLKGPQPEAELGPAMPGLVAPATPRSLSRSACRDRSQARSCPGRALKLMPVAWRLLWPGLVRECLGMSLFCNPTSQSCVYIDPGSSFPPWHIPVARNTLQACLPCLLLPRSQLPAASPCSGESKVLS